MQHSELILVAILLLLATSMVLFVLGLGAFVRSASNPASYHRSIILLAVGAGCLVSSAGASSLLAMDMFNVQFAGFVILAGIATGVVIYAALLRRP